MNNLKSIKDLKNDVDIVEYVSKFISLKKRGANFVACCPFHGEESPSFSVSPAKQVFKCFGCGVGGDLFDFAEKIENISNVDAINKIRAFDGSEVPASKSEYPSYAAKNYQKPKQEIKPLKTDEEISKKLYGISQAILKNNKDIKIFKSIKLDIDDVIKYEIQIDPAFQKLLEKKSFYIDKKLFKRLTYILDNCLAYDSFFKCPAIIIKDHKNKVVDIAKYRPNKPDSFESFSNPKYMYVKEEDKLKERGENFLYPFSIENDRLIKKNSFFFIGEGIKNALVALIYGIPFISLESVSNGINETLKEYIKELAKTKKIIGAFDGDGDDKNKTNERKGKYAHDKTKEILDLNFDNIFKFDSNIDFADYLKNETDLIDFEAKFEELFISKVNFYDNH